MRSYLDRQGNPDGSTAVSHSRSEGVHVACLQHSHHSKDAKAWSYQEGT